MCFRETIFSNSRTMQAIPSYVDHFMSAFHYRLILLLIFYLLWIDSLVGDCAAVTSGSIVQHIPTPTFMITT